MASENKVVLAIGVRGLKGWTPEEGKKLVELENEKAAQAGFDLEWYSINLEASEAQTLDEVKQVLQKRKWEGVGFGFGIRGDRDRTPLFEKVINMAIEQVHPSPKIAFPVLPDKIVEAFERVFD